MRQFRYFLLLVLLIVLIVAVIGILQIVKRSPPITSPEIKAGEAVTLRGDVIKNNLGCTVDGLCSIEVQSDKGLVVVGYAEGWTQCNQNAADVGIKLVQGDRVEVLARAESSNYLSTCDSDNYYIRKIVDDVTVGDFVMYKRDAGWSPCPEEFRPCTEIVTVWMSGLVTIEGQRTAQFQLTSEQVSAIAQQIATTGVIDKQCPAAPVMDYGAIYYISTGSRDITIQYPGCKEDTALIEKTIDDFIDDESLPPMQGGA